MYGLEFYKNWVESRGYRTGAKRKKLPDFIFEVHEEIIRTNQTFDNEIASEKQI